MIVTELAHRQHRVDPLALFQRQQVDDGATARGPASLRQFVDFLPVHLAVVGETKNGVVGAGDKQLVDKIFFLEGGGRPAAPAAFLRSVQRQGLRLDVAGVRQRDHHGLFVDQVFEIQVLLVGQNLGATGVAVLGTQLQQLGANHRRQAFRHGKDFQKILDAGQQILILVQQLALFQPGQPV